ncbi:MAG: helix-turn-helix domain-containing protein [Lachnospiraceae bacterium]|nr:helix-turn-helix domain-containing protein [Ruminococcus sp.]MCM1275376.1 helix-turn-helix domain-containing protein [Lachnospiraceae bacterium]
MDSVGYDFGLILRNLRERANLTQKQLGNRIGVSEGMISRYENNMSEPPFDKIRNLAAVFNVSMDYLAGMEKKKMLSAQRLTDEQTNILIDLIDLFMLQNEKQKPTLSLEQYKVLIHIVEIFTGK